MGHYEQVGDVAEWRWDEGEAPTVTVPEGEFDPRDPVEKPVKKTATKPEAKADKK